jgi:serine/threonine protein kinase
MKMKPIVPERYLLLEKLGQGGGGIVYRALDTERGRQVALKSLNTARPDDLYRLKREFRFFADIRHPHLVRLYDLFAHGFHCFVTMELVEGTDLVSFAQSGHPARPSFDYGRLRVVAAQLASALCAVHSAGKLHRDIKPSNVLVTRGGRVVLLDFGLAANLRPQDAKTQGAGMLLGTHGYMSPEQARGEALSVASDWYAFGVTLFEAIAGKLPFDHPRRAFQTDPESNASRHVGKCLRGVPKDLDELIANLLDPDPCARPAPAEVLRAISGEAVPPKRNFVFSRRSTTVARRLALAAENAGALVLRSRCHPRESVPFNAWDGIMDDLTHVLEHSLRLTAPALRPNILALSRIFPVMARLDTNEETAVTVAAKEGDSEVARRALRDLLGAISRHQPLVMWIDDANSADRESRALLTELLRSPEAPQMLVLLS